MSDYGDVIVTYECPIEGNPHCVPGPNVRVMKVGDAGFVIACNCSAEPLSEADEKPHPTVDHLVNVYGDGPSPEEWLRLDNASEGWYGTTRFDSPDGYPGTNGRRRERFREKVKNIADRMPQDDPDKREKKQARKVECPACGANQGRKCQRPSGHRVQEPHADRVEAAKQAGYLQTPETNGQERDTEQTTISKVLGC